MNVRINQLVKSLLQKDSIEQCSIQELQQYAERHPYFGAAQLLLAKKMKVENDEQYNDQLQKTYLFFHNPLWVEALLNETGTAIIKGTEKEIFIEKESPVTDTALNEPEEKVIVNSSPVVSNTIPNYEKEEEEFIPIPETVQEHLQEEAEEINSPEPEEMKPMSGNIISGETDKSENDFNKVPQVVATTENFETTSAIINPTTEAEEQPIKIPGLKIEAIDAATAEFNFGPYYAIDYFASQGIKFKEEEKPKDKFAQNLKSFTDWLKVMKRLPVTEIVKNSNAVAEKKVEQMAEHSLEMKEVLTEAMAEVWEKQGNKEKAIEIYTKLSLLEPAKSTYFAAKIEGLKKTNQT